MAESATLAGNPATVPSPWAPLHCGAPMQWRSPEPGAMSSYSFGPADPSLALPAVWRCPCGFQLDGDFQPNGDFQLNGDFQPNGLEQDHAGVSPSISR
ncbi:hypothetical protein SRABI26_03463 [Arthrobacter sp. Bi26]|uniref:hypothetical protein n=1 Tax=Arthrobacter sp. Bi26 TaxID=2822350 RepID=UPI001DAE0B19|nr:hypothetical protein [Arthrobacter sp. Bi26]CAH0263752.1 hypothetical protein SRABI26_03463 [Arthrobacter sp. Bi26]